MKSASQKTFIEYIDYINGMNPHRDIYMDEDVSTTFLCIDGYDIGVDANPNGLKFYDYDENNLVPYDDFTTIKVQLKEIFDEKGITSIGWGKYVNS